MRGSYTTPDRQFLCCSWSVCWFSINERIFYVLCIFFLLFTYLTMLCFVRRKCQLVCQGNTWILKQDVEKKHHLFFSLILLISSHSSVSLISVIFNVVQKLHAYYAASSHSICSFSHCHPFTSPSYSSSSSSTFSLLFQRWKLSASLFFFVHLLCYVIYYVSDLIFLALS